MSALFSVVIPTLQRSERLPRLLRALDASPAVGEILLINNSSDPLAEDLPKLRVLQQRENIFVNPAWNLGVAQATHPLVAVLNDEIWFPMEHLEPIARFLEQHEVGIIGIGNETPDYPRFLARRTRPTILPAPRRTFGYGTALFLRRERWVPVPERLTICCGDDWVFNQQTRLNQFVIMPGYETDMAATSKEPQFSIKERAEVEEYAKIRPTAYRDAHPVFVRGYGLKLRLSARAGLLRARLRRSLGRRP